ISLISKSKPTSRAAAWPSVRGETALHLHVIPSDVLPKLIPLSLVRSAAEAEEEDARNAKGANTLHDRDSMADTGAFARRPASPEEWVDFLPRRTSSNAVRRL